MRITSKGQVTIPAGIRAEAGLLPHTDVSFAIENGVVCIRPAPSPRDDSRGAQVVALLLGRAPKSGMTTDEIMAMTRGED